MALDLLRNQPHIGLAADRRVREHVAQGGDMEGARKVIQRRFEKSGVFSIDIGGQVVTPTELAERAKGAFARVGQDAPEPLRSVPLPGMERPSGPETIKQVRDEIERAEETTSASAPADGPTVPQAIPPAGPPVERVVTRFGDAVSQELGLRDGKGRSNND